MLLSKEIAVYLNLAGCKLKQYSAFMLKRSHVNLTPEQFLLADELWNNDSMTQQQLADNMQKDKNSITKLVDALERKGLVTREKNTTDRRSNIIALTPKAIEMKTDAKEKGIAMLDNILTGISEEELRNFLVTLKKMSDNMSTTLEEK